VDSETGDLALHAFPIMMSQLSYGALARSHNTCNSKKLPKLILFLTVAYFIAVLGHFAHDAELRCE
jgi:hypothetical protein